MKNVAVVNPLSGLVENVVVVDEAMEWSTPVGSQLVEIDGRSASIGWSYDASQDVFIQPEVPPTVETPVLSCTPLQFVDRFTDDEQLAIVSATMSNPAVKLWYDKLLAAQEVVFADPRLSAGLDNLVAAGLITAERKAQILPNATEGVTVL